MALKRKFGDTEEGEDCVKWSSSLYEDRLSAADDVAWISWRSHSQASIQQLLQGDPTTVSLVKQLGLVKTFSIPYRIPKIHAVKQFAQGFNPDGNYCDFRGRKLAFTTDVLREAFLLPSGKFSPHKDYWRDDPELTKMFPEQKRSPYALGWLKGDYEKWVKPILTFQELVLGKKRPTEVTGKQMWCYFAYLSNKVEPSGRPDWAVLVHNDLKREIVRLKNYLGRSEDELRNSSWKGKRLACNCGTAVTRILMHFGFTEEELSHPTSGTRNMVEKVKIEQSHVVTRMMDLGVKQNCTQVDTAAPSAAQLGKEKENATRKQRSVGGEPIAGSADGVHTTSSTGSMLVFIVDEEGRVMSTKVEKKKSTPAPLVDLWHTLGENFRSQLDAARIQIQAGTTERENKVAALLLEKDNFESKLKVDMRIHEKEMDKAKMDIADLKGKLHALEEEKSRLGTAHETNQRLLEEEKERSLCRICFDSRIDTISFPCLHLQYCFTCLNEHNKRSRTCPTCRMPISGVLRVNIWT